MLPNEASTTQGTKYGWGGLGCAARLRWNKTACSGNADIVRELATPMLSVEACIRAVGNDTSCGAGAAQWDSATHKCSCTRPGILCEDRCVPALAETGPSLVEHTATHLYEATPECAAVPVGAFGNSTTQWTTIYQKFPGLGFNNWGEDAVDNLFWNSPWKIIRRTCKQALAPHAKAPCSVVTGACPFGWKDVYYRRYTQKGSFSPFADVLTHWGKEDNVIHVDYDLFSNLKDALARTNAWENQVTYGNLAKVLYSYEPAASYDGKVCLGETLGTNASNVTLTATVANAAECAMVCASWTGEGGGLDTAGCKYFSLENSTCIGCTTAPSVVRYNQSGLAENCSGAGGHSSCSHLREATVKSYRMTGETRGVVMIYLCLFYFL